ncbi:hypothetical protein RIEGSTA812A_PEG_1201 [invertebrate metagenome]|uniref:AB hydrolase-1 domain-containing protein n=1 Tax=invertebrate metagenome TaxID=1711999 RepID=A0A484HC39_9ZZZZ
MQRNALENMLIHWLLWPMVAGMGGYAMLVGVMHTMQRSFMYYPHPIMTSPVESGVPEMQAVHLSSSDALTLTSWYAPPRAGQPTVLYCHGNAGNIATRAFKVKPFLKDGYGVILVGYRGYGANPGAPTEAGLYADAQAALRYLLTQGIVQDHIVIYGESLGSGIAVHLATVYHPGALILEAPFTSAIDVAQLTYWYLPVQQLMKDRFDSINRIRHVNAPVLMLHGKRDGVVPITLGKRLFAAAVDPKEFATFPDGMHADLHEHGAASRALDFIRRHIRMGR